VGQLENVTICGSPIIVESTQGRKLSIELTFDAKLRVKLPGRFPRHQALSILSNLETEWADKIRHSQQRWQQYWHNLSTVRLLDDQIPLIRDPSYSSEKGLFFNGETLVYTANTDGFDYIDALASFYRTQAKERFPNIVNDLWVGLNWHDIKEPSLRVKRLKSRWGSCSSMNNINLNLWLMGFTQQDLEYVVLHEFCHLREMNHSKRFYQWMDTVMPNWRMYELQFNQRVAAHWLPFR